MDYVSIISSIILLSIIALTFLAKNYLIEKGKNIATKEDISQITDNIESVKLEYAKQLESTKALFSSQIKNHGFRYEKEYEILTELSSLLVDLRDSAINLRPTLDFRDLSKSEEEIKKERLKKFYSAQLNLYQVREKKRPFFPDEIYQAIKNIEKKARSESIDYQFKDPDDGRKVLEYWEKAEKNQNEISELAENAIFSIRDRVIKWDSISHDL